MKMNGEISQGMFEEAKEEMAEFVGEELVKQVGNTWVKLGWSGREYGEIGKGRFKDVFDKGYWAEFGEGITVSAVMGAAGGAFAKSAIGKKMFFDNHPERKDYDSFLLNSVLDGNYSYVVGVQELLLRVMPTHTHASDVISLWCVSVVRNLCRVPDAFDV